MTSLTIRRGDEKAALESIHNLFGLTRDTLKRNYGWSEVARIAVVVLNQIVCPVSTQMAPVKPRWCVQQRPRLP